MYNKIKNFILVLGFVCVLSILTCCKHMSQTNNRTIDEEAITADSNGFYCFLEYYHLGGVGINHIQLLLNDSTSLLRTQAGFNGTPYIQITLNKQVSDYIKSLLMEIYPKHNSVVKDQYINKVLAISSFTSKCKIIMNINGKRINESIDLSNYEITFDNPFYPQFEKLLSLLYAITEIMERDIYRNPFIIGYSAPEEWITEMFHGNYYEPYNEINSKQYVIPKQRQ